MSKEALAEVEATADDTSAEASKAHEQSLDDAMSVLASDQDWSPDPADRGDFLPETPEPEIPVELDAVEKPVEVEQEFEDEGVVQEAAPEPEAEKPHMIPKSRLDSQIRKTRELEEAKIRMEEQMKFLQAQIDANKPAEPAEQAPQQPAYDYAERYKQMQEYTLDGESDKAAEVFQEILNQQQQEMQAQVQNQIQSTYEQNRQNDNIQMELAAAATELMAEYPELDINQTETFNSELTREINELMGALTTIKTDQGTMKYSPAQALRQAVAMKMPARTEAPQNLGQEAAPQTGNLQKKVQAANGQPPKLPGDRGTSHGQTPRIDPLNMTEEDFDALPASTLARLRGDI